MNRREFVVRSGKDYVRTKDGDEPRLWRIA